MRNYVIYLSLILPIIAATRPIRFAAHESCTGNLIGLHKKNILLQPVYFFKSNSAEPAPQHLLVQSGEQFCGFVLYEKEQQHVNTWVLYECKTGITGSFLEDILLQQEWLKQPFESVTIIEYTKLNTLVPSSLLMPGTETTVMDFVTGNPQQTVALEDRTAVAANLYRVPATAYVALCHLFQEAKWMHHESLVIDQPATEEATITVELWFNTFFLFAEKEGQWLLLQQRSYQTPEDVLYHILNCKEQWNMGEDVTVQLQGMVEEHSALYSLLHQYILNLELNKDLQFYYPSNTSDIPNHTKQLIDRILTCVS